MIGVGVDNLVGSGAWAAMFVGVVVEVGFGVWAGVLVQLGIGV